MDQIAVEEKPASGDYTTVDFDDLESVEVEERDRKN
jgi:hypothetical protein